MFVAYFRKYNIIKYNIIYFSSTLHINSAFRFIIESLTKKYTSYEWFNICLKKSTFI